MCSPIRCSNTLLRVVAPTTLMPLTRAACWALLSGTMMQGCLVALAHSAKLSAPLTLRSSPFNPSSPANKTPLATLAGSCLLAIKIDRAIARSR